MTTFQSQVFEIIIQALSYIKQHKSELEDAGIVMKICLT